MTPKPEGLKPCPVCKLSHCISKGVGPCVTVEPVPLTVTAWNRRSSPVGAGEPVAWRFTLSNGVTYLHATKAEADHHAKNNQTVPEPLYASPVGGIDREAWARIIDPKGWATFDRQTAELNRIAATAEPIPPAAYDGPKYYTRDSLAKADQIIALAQGVSSSGDQSDSGAPPLCQPQSGAK